MSHDAHDELEIFYECLNDRETGRKSEASFDVENLNFDGKIYSSGVLENCKYLYITLSKLETDCFTTGRSFQKNLYHQIISEKDSEDLEKYLAFYNKVLSSYNLFNIGFPELHEDISDIIRVTAPRCDLTEFFTTIIPELKFSEEVDSCVMEVIGENYVKMNYSNTSEINSADMIVRELCEDDEKYIKPAIDYSIGFEDIFLTSTLLELSESYPYELSKFDDDIGVMIDMCDSDGDYSNLQELVSNVMDDGYEMKVSFPRFI